MRITVKPEVRNNAMTSVLIKPHFSPCVIVVFLLTYLCVCVSLPSTCVCMDGFCFPRYGCISFNTVCARVCVCVRLPPKPPPCVIVVFLSTYLCVCVSLYWQGFQQVSLVLVVPSPQIYINELQKSDNVTDWKWPQVCQQNITQRSRV